MVDNVANLAISFVIGIFVARYLGPSDLGLLNFAKSIANVFVVFCTLGLEKILVKDLIKKKLNYELILGTGLALKVLASGLSILIFSTFGNLAIREPLSYQLTLIFVLVTFFDAFSVIRFYFQSQVKSRFTSRVALVKIIITSLIKFLLIYLGLPVIYFAYVGLFEAFVGTMGLIYVLHKRSGHRLWQFRFNVNYGKGLVKDAWPLLLSNFVVLVYMEIDQVMIKYMIDASAVGHYSVSVKFTNVWFFVGATICSSLFPAILNAKNHNEELYRSRMQNLLKLLAAISITISLFVFLISKPLVNILFGSEFLPSVPALQIQVWSLVFVYMGIAGSQWYIAEDLQKLLLLRSFVGAVCNILLNLLLIPRYGINGAAIATLVSQVIVNVIGNLYSAKTRQLLLMQFKAFKFF